MIEKNVSEGYRPKTCGILNKKLHSIKTTAVLVGFHYVKILAEKKLFKFNETKRKKLTSKLIHFYQLNETRSGVGSRRWSTANSSTFYLVPLKVTALMR